MIIRLFLFIIFTISLELIPKEPESVTLNDSVNTLRKELQQRNFLLQLKKYKFLLVNNQRVQFILVKQGRLFSTAIGVASDEKNNGFKIAIYELFDAKNYDSKELIEKFTVTDKIFLREIHDTALYYLIEIEMIGSDSNGSAVELVHGFSSIRLKSINKNPNTNPNLDGSNCNFGNCGIIHRVDWK
jgi:hypothetical protein